MRKLNYLLRVSAMIALCITIAGGSYAQGITTPPGGGKQKSINKQYIGSMVFVEITYNSPDVHAPNGTDRTGKIWGQLVPYGLTDLGFG